MESTMLQRSTLTETDNVFSAKPRPFEPRLKIVSRIDTHADTVRFLMDEIEMRYGIVPTEALSKKLFRAFEHLTLKEFDDWAEQLAALPAGDPGWLSLVECLTSHETYFNRDPDLLQLVRWEILPELIGRAEKKSSPAIRILSVGCATGEDAYDLAFLLLDALQESGHARAAADGTIVVHPCWSIEILGCDLSRQAMEVAVAAVYSDHWLGSFQRIRQKMWRFFEGAPGPEKKWLPGAGYWQVKRFVRQHVRFQRFNPLAGLPPETDCDLTICRDLMTSFDQEAKLRVQEMLALSLKPGSFLLQGSSDAQLLPELYQEESAAGVRWYRRKG